MRRTLFGFLTTLALLGSGCLHESTAAGWERLAGASGTNACNMPNNEWLPLTRFVVDHQRLVANFSITLSAGVVDFQLVNPFNTAVFSHRYTGSGQDSIPVETPMAGSWEFRVNCPTFAAFDYQWHVNVDGLRASAS